MGQRRRKCAIESKSKPKLQNGFKESWKLCLSLLLHKGLRPSRNFVINLNFSELWQLKRLLVDEFLIHFRIFVLKILNLLEFFMLWSILFHSIIVDGKKVFFKKVFLVLKVFWTNNIVERTPNLVLHIVFPLKCLWLPLLLWDNHCTVADLVFDEMIRYKLGHIQVLKSERNMVFFFCFSSKYYLLSLFARIRIETNFHRQAHLLIFTKSLFNSFAVVFALWTAENNELSSENRFVFDDRPSSRLFRYVEDSNGRIIDPWGTLALTSAQKKVCPLRTTLCFLFLRNLITNLKV